MNHKKRREHLLKEKLKSQKAETLAEVLVGILFIALASSMFLSLVSVSQKINARTKEADETFYKAMSHLECFTADQSLVKSKESVVTVSIGEEGMASQRYKVQLFYGEDMMSYQEKLQLED